MSEQKREIAQSASRNTIAQNEFEFQVQSTDYKMLGFDAMLNDI